MSESGAGDVARDRLKAFTYDHSYWTVDPGDRNYASQTQVQYQSIDFLILKTVVL